MNATATYSTTAWSRRCSTESILSIQGRETDVARDTSDTEAGEDLEYEPVTESEDEFPVDCDDTDITDEEIIQTKVIEVSVVEDRDLVFADSEPTDSAESDSEIDFNDYYQCAQCNAHNDNPLYRYCDKCFRSRKHFFPPRPKRKLKRRPVIQDLPQPLSQDSGFDTCPSQDLDTGTSIPDKSTSNAGKHRSKSSPKADKYTSKSGYRNPRASDSDVDELPGQSSQDVFDFDTIPSAAKKSRSNPRATSVISDDDFTGRSSLKDLAFNTILDETKKSLAGQSSQDVLAFNTTRDKSRKRSRRSESADREPKRTKHDSDDETTVQTLVKTISDPSITIEDSVKLSKKVLANTLKEMVTKDSKDNNMCFICVTEPKSGVFVHGRIAHICCCYKCAMKVWSTAKRCPICNRKVSNVLKAVIT